MWVYCRWLAGIVVQNPAGGMDVCLLLVLCVFKLRSVRGADNSYRGTIPNEVCPMSVIAKPRKGEAVDRNRLEAPQERVLNEVRTKLMLFIKMYFFHDCISVVGVRILNHSETRCSC
jgi:hypothetical protein